MADPAGVKVKGAAELARKTDEMARRLERPSGAEGRFTAAFRSRIERRFDHSGDGEWAPLSAATVETKAGKGQDPRILRATGALHAAVTAGHATVGSGQISYDPSGAPLYAAIVNARRPIIGDGDPQLAQDVLDAYAEHVMRAK
jgi:hypothetical protein